MSISIELFRWLADNDSVIKVITAIAAPGGIWVYVDKFRNRIRVKVRKLGLPPGDSSIRGIEFEAENISSVMTSFEPQFTLTGYSPEGKKQTYIFTFDSRQDRQLLPHVQKSFVGWHSHAENRILLFLWFMTFRLQLSRGRAVRVRFRNSGFQPIGNFRFCWERLLFRWFGRVPE